MGHQDVFYVCMGGIALTVISFIICLISEARRPGPPVDDSQSALPIMYGIAIGSQINGHHHHQ